MTNALLAALSVAVTTASSVMAAPSEAAPSVAPATPTTAERRWALIPGAEIAIATPTGTAATLFSTAADLRLSAALARGRSRWRLPVSLWYRRTLDPSPAEGVAFLGGWVHPEITFLQRIVASAGLGWQWRRIEIDATVSTHGSLSLMSSLGVRFRPGSRIELTTLARYDRAQPIASEEFPAQYLGLALSVALIPGDSGSAPRARLDERRATLE